VQNVFDEENFCNATVTPSPVTSASVTSCNDGILQTYTVSGLGWTASAIGVGSSPGDLEGNVSGSASFSPEALILGGTGSGFLQVEYTDTLSLPTPPGGLGVDASMTAGNLSASFQDEYCLYNYQECVLSLTDAIWSAWIPFTFGEAVTLPEMSVSFAFSFVEGGGSFSASESVTAFDIVDANMNPLPLAYATQIPEPSVFYLCGAGLILVAGYRWYPKGPKV
jgi:hypothetical protein